MELMNHNGKASGNKFSKTLDQEGLKKLMFTQLYKEKVGNVVSPLKIGSHIPLSTVHSDSEFFQIFLGSPSTYQRRDIWTTRIRRDKKFFVHAPYSINLANEARPSIKELSIQWMQDALLDLAGYNCSIVFHTGKLGSMASFAEGIERLLQLPYPNRKLLLEGPTGKGTELCATIDDLRKLYEATHWSNKLGFCLDTCHSFSAGWTDYENPQSTEKLLELLEPIVSSVDLVHLNDSSSCYNSKEDYHESIGEGYIWHKDDSSLMRLLELTESSDTHVILETPCHLDLNYVKDRYNYHKNKLDILDFI